MSGANILQHIGNQDSAAIKSAAPPTIIQLKRAVKLLTLIRFIRHSAAYDLGLHYLLRPVLPNT